MIELKELKLEEINYENIEHLNYLKQLMQSSDISYLWDLNDKNLSNNKNQGKYIVLNDKNERIGYLNISDPTEAYYGSTVSIYYAVLEKFRGNNYGQMIITEVSEWLFNKNKIECIVAQADVNNYPSKNTLIKAGMKEINKDDEYITFIQTKNR